MIMMAEGVVDEGNLLGAPIVLNEGGATEGSVIVSRESLRKIQTWLRRAQGRYNNHDLKLSLKVLEEIMGSGTPKL